MITNNTYTDNLTEFNELSEKVKKLDRYVYECRHNRVSNITLEDIHLAEEQLAAMNKYLYLLKIRITRMEGV